MLRLDTIQDALTGLEAKYSERLEAAEWLSRKLVSNQGNKSMPFLNIFGLKEGFSYDLASELVRRSGVNPGDRFLDPFSGAGTSILAASTYGLDSYGIELLPIGRFLYDTLKSALEVDAEALKLEMRKSLEYIKSDKEPSRKYEFPHLKITSGAFPQKTELDIANYLQYVDQVRDVNVKQLMNFACFSVLEKTSFTRKDGQYLRWDKRSGRTLSGDYQKREILPFHEAITQALKEVLSTVKYNYFSGQYDKEVFERIRMIKGSSLEKLPSMDKESINLIISSPPYCNRYDYTRTYALELAFLGTNNEELKEYRQQLLSCTVENKGKEEWLLKIYDSLGRSSAYSAAKLAFDGNAPLQSILGQLKDAMYGGRLNNKGIYRMVYNYFFEHSFIIHEMARVLKIGGKIFYVNDNVRYAGISIPVDLILSDFAESAGLTVNKIYYLKRGKGNSSQQMGFHGREEQRKCVYYWEKL